jgi:hypothetical protein
MMRDVLIRVLVPREIRDAFVGDLLEEAAQLRRSRRWFVGQLLASVPYLLAYRIRRGGVDARARWIMAATTCALALLQVWASGTLEAGLATRLLVFGSVAVYVLGLLLCASHDARALLFMAAVGILLVGRIVSPTADGSSELLIVGVIYYGALVTLWAHERRTRPARLR